MKESYKLLIGDRTAEEIKKRIGTAWRGSRSDSMDVSGRDLVTGLPHTITLNSEETELAMRESLQDVVRACRTVLEQTPPELSADIVSRGVVLTGGGALLQGIDQLLINELNVPVYVAEKRAVLRGGRHRNHAGKSAPRPLTDISSPVSGELSLWVTGGCFHAAFN